MNDADRRDSELITREVFPGIAEKRRHQTEAAFARLLKFQRQLGNGLLTGTCVAVLATIALILWKLAN